MSKMIHGPKRPGQASPKLKARAALEGLSLSDYLREEIQRVTDRPTLAELAERLQHRQRVRPSSCQPMLFEPSASGRDRSRCFGDP